MKAKDCEIKTRKVGGLEGEYLQESFAWDKDAAITLAAQDNLTLENSHWLIINKIRSYDQKYQAYPNNKAFREYVLHPLEISYETFKTLFPKEIRQACRISGTSLPTGYGTGIGE